MGNADKADESRIKYRISCPWYQNQNRLSRRTSTLNKIPMTPPQKIDDIPCCNFLIDSGLPMLQKNWFDLCYASGILRQVCYDLRSGNFHQFSGKSTFANMAKIALPLNFSQQNKQENESSSNWSLIWIINKSHNTTYSRGEKQHLFDFKMLIFFLF